MAMLLEKNVTKYFRCDRNFLSPQSRGGDISQNILINAYVDKRSVFVLNSVTIWTYQARGIQNRHMSSCKPEASLPHGKQIGRIVSEANFLLSDFLFKSCE